MAVLEQLLPILIDSRNHRVARTTLSSSTCHLGSVRIRSKGISRAVASKINNSQTYPEFKTVQESVKLPKMLGRQLNSTRLVAM